jgi:hypothetical protein
MLCGVIIWNGVNDKKKFHHSMRHNEKTCSRQTANLVGIGYPLFLTLWLAVVSVVETVGKPVNIDTEGGKRGGNEDKEKHGIPIQTEHHRVKLADILSRTVRDGGGRTRKVPTLPRPGSPPINAPSTPASSCNSSIILMTPPLCCSPIQQGLLVDGTRATQHSLPVSP